MNKTNQGKPHILRQKAEYMRKTKLQVPMHALKTKEMASLGFSIINLSGISGKTYDSDVPHRHTFYELMYFSAGSGHHEIDFRVFPIEPDSVHFVAPGQIHQLIPMEVHGFVLCFSEEFASLNHREALVERFPYYDQSKQSRLKLNAAASAEIRTLIESAQRDLQSNRAMPAELYRSYLNIILLKLNEWSQQNAQRSGEPGKHPKVQAFKRLLNHSYLNDKSPSSYAKRLAMSANHLNALCKKHEGRTAIQLIHDRMALEAKRLLYATDLTIKEISYRLGFEDVAYFNRFFKKQSKQTPLEYRKEQRQH